MDFLSVQDLERKRGLSDRDWSNMDFDISCLWQNEEKYIQINMFILVKYGNNETLLCNPSCAVINLLTNIKRRAGYGNSNVTVDLSDETGAY